ncbi:MAG: hypothetical protein MJZ15_02180 [Bacteroidales bacterium]|nr:hypothetical protein [Bacteroidales bacterium]
MSIVVFFVVVIAFSLALTAIDKIRSFKKEDKSVWADSDSVVIRLNDKNNEKQEDGFMVRLS